MTASRTLLVLRGCHQGVHEWHLDKVFRRFLHNFKGLAKDENAAVINKAMGKMGNDFNQSVPYNFNLSVDEDAWRSS